MRTVSNLAGRESQARQYFDESIKIAQAQGAQREHAKSLLVRGEVGLKFGWSDTGKDVADARPLVVEMETLEVSQGSTSSVR